MFLLHTHTQQQGRQLLYGCQMRSRAAYLYNRYDKCKSLATACWCRHANISRLIATSSNQQSLLGALQDSWDDLLLYWEKIKVFSTCLTKCSQCNVGSGSVFPHACLPPPPQHKQRTILSKIPKACHYLEKSAEFHYFGVCS